MAGGEVMTEEDILAAMEQGAEEPTTRTGNTSEVGSVTAQAQPRSFAVGQLLPCIHLWVCLCTDTHVHLHTWACTHARRGRVE